MRLDPLAERRPPVGPAPQKRGEQHNATRRSNMQARERRPLVGTAPHSGASDAMLIEQRAGTSSRGHGVARQSFGACVLAGLREVRPFDNIGNMKATTHRNFEMVDPGSVDGCWVDVLTEPIVEGLTRLPRSVLANDFRSVGTAVCCGHGSSRVGSPHVRLLRTLSRQRTRHCRCLEENHHAAAPCPESHRS